MELNFIDSEYLEIGKKFYSLHGVKAAMPYLDKCIQFNPENAEAWLYKGYCFNHQHKFEEPVKCYSRAIEIEPDNAEALYARGTCYMEIEDLENAVNDLKAAVEIYGFNYHYNLSLAYGLLKLKKFEECIPICNEILAEDNSRHDELVSYYKYSSLLNLKRYDEAIETLKKQIHFSPQESSYHNNMGYAVLKKGDFSASIQHFDAALNYNLDDAYAMNNKGWALFKVGHYNKAYPLFRRSIESDVSNSMAYLNLAHYYLKTGDRDEAKLNLLKARELQHALYHDNEVDDLLLKEFGITPN